MKRGYLLIGLLMSSSTIFAQITNTFPDNGKVGIGTLTPTEKLEVHGNVLWNGFNSGNPRALKTGYSGGNYGGIGYNIDFTESTGLFNRPIADFSSYLEFWYGGFKFFGSENNASSQGVNLNGSGDNLKLFATITRAGNFGVGTDNPLQKFVVSDNGADGFEVYHNQSGIIGLQSYNRASSNYVKMQFDASNFAFNQGDVGIGTTDTKGYKLAVNGKIRTQEIKVENTNWPDYVFTKDYQLPTLQQTENHIKEKGHLPGIPSAEEVKANGIDLGEMNAKLLQKIEELTLFIIKQNKEIKEISTRLNTLELKKD